MGCGKVACLVVPAVLIRSPSKQFGNVCECIGVLFALKLHVQMVRNIVQTIKPTSLKFHNSGGSLARALVIYVFGNTQKTFNFIVLSLDFV